MSYPAHTPAFQPRHALAAEHCMPEFVTRRMDEHYLTRVQQLLGGEHMHVWQAAGAGAVMLASNDYLCIASQQELVQAQLRCLAASGGDMLMSSVFLQEGSFQHRLEAKFAALMQAEDSVLAQSGWTANVGLLQSIAEPGVPVYLDMMAHASLWEGVQSAGAHGVPFLHNDAGHLQRQVDKHGRGVIVIDALYSTNGSVAPLLDVVEIGERSGSILVVELGLAERVHFRTASLAKAFAGRAGVVTCSRKFKGYFLSASRPAIFSSCLLGHELAWFDAALDFIAQADGRRAALRRVTRQVRSGLAGLGYNISDGSEQIIALEAGPEPRTLALRKALERRGIYGAVFCAPATPKNRSLVRLTLNAGLQAHQVDKLIDACADIRDEVDMQSWPSTRRRLRLV